MKHDAVETPSKDQAGAGIWKSNLRDYGLLGSLLVIIALFEYLTGGVLLAPVNITNLILQNSYIVIMALGMLLIIVGGNIDLSVGSIVGFIGAIAATMMVDYKLPWIPVVGISLVAGGLIGAAQGYFVAYAKIPSFIVTLGGMLVFRGLTGNILLGQFVGPFPKDFQSISSGFIPDVVSAPLLALFGDGIGANFRWTSMLVGLVGAALLIFTSARRWRRAKAHTMETEPLALFIGKNAVFALLIAGFCYLLASYRGLPNVLIIMGALILLYMFVTQRMTIGRRIYALGGNRMAAQLSGIRTERLIFLTFVNMGALAGLAGLIVAARLNSATPSAGNSFELDVIAACFIGGASASGGVGKVMGVVIGAFVMGVMNNGMSILGIGIYWQYVVKGLVLLAAVYVDGYQKNIR
ncbi:sugar ABC transporter permease [Bradyrhizobium sp. KBS0727]|uniref:multiple monosaccharide ABC transporter permease n=1 Tax=unclassified Bradyrhizobium TaxID=2631580 RepID=UPI00110EF2B6|nr:MULTISPECIES: multiple monosaccharide ABC transporter permease [unclassified Bradyrhizobium]QDW36576.1 sugar ABC transporter permease [Bradyrhizobium sp. KBS0725]QDW43177.1 sugar ABC transporter permease [Bradyrhizobium sp. KBS0727]